METTALYDLHLHTTASDGKLPPRELVRAAKSSGLRAISITDHDTVDGIPEAIEEAAAAGIELVPGVEVSANFGEASVHVLGLFIQYREPWLERFFSEASRRRIDRVHQITRKLGKLGIDIDPEAVFARSTHGTVGRPHVAEVLVERGVVSTMSEAFERFLGQDGPAYVGYERVTLKDAVDLIRRAGGVASLAHPVLLGDDSLIPQMVGDDLQAIEVFHKDHTPEKAAEYGALASELGLLATGGSDFHRSEDGEPPCLGCRELTEEAFERVRASAR
ncbi:MAG: PHP domain-containing protein [Vicinamibacteria bacterium]